MLNHYLYSTPDVVTASKTILIWGERHLGPEGVLYKCHHRYYDDVTVVNVGMMNSIIIK